MLKLNYSPDQTRLDLTQNEKIVSSHLFVECDKYHDHENKPVCTLCCFDSIGCDDVKCCSDERIDKKNGYYTTIE
jgi:hypothetical protein